MFKYSFVMFIDSQIVLDSAWVMLVGFKQSFMFKGCQLVDRA